MCVFVCVCMCVCACFVLCLKQSWVWVMCGGGSGCVLRAPSYAVVGVGDAWGREWVCVTCPVLCSHGCVCVCVCVRVCVCLQIVGERAYFLA